MINITRNKKLFARKILRQQMRLEKKFYKDLYPVLNSVWKETAEKIQHGDVLNIVPYIVSYNSKKIKDAIKQNYRQIGQFAFKEITDRLQEIKPKKISNYYYKDAVNNFWFYYNIWVNQQALNKVSLINATTKNVLRNVIDNGIKNGKSYGDIAKDIVRLSDISNKNRAMMIAITETHTAFNKSIFSSIESENVKMETKEWMNAGDERVRSEPFDHVSANGEMVGMHEMFQATGEDLMYPGDPNGDPGNIIRCRCVVLYNTEVTTIGGE